MEKFKLGKKWFWIGVAICFIYPIAGLVYAIALLCEKAYRKEGWILIAIVLILGLIGGMAASYFINKGYFTPGSWQFIKSPKEGEILPLIQE